MNEKIGEAGRSALNVIRQMIADEMAKNEGIDAAERLTDGTLATGGTPLSSINISGEARVGLKNGTVSR